MMLLAMFGLLAQAAMASDYVKFNYQGRLLVHGAPFTGAGAVKIAIVNTSGTVTLWSNDGTSVGGSEPTASVSVTITNGIFDLMVGDAALGMQAIHGALFNGRDDHRLRAWLNDGAHGFQQLTPDREIPNARMLGLAETRQNLDIYVNGTTGNDLYSGLSADQAKKTIQAAVDMAPKNQFKSVVTIHIANGVYREEVGIYGFNTWGGGLVLQGDMTTTVDATTDPQVRVTGADNDSTQAAVRSYGINVERCGGVHAYGILADYCSSAGFHSTGYGSYFDRCVAKNNSALGFRANMVQGDAYYNCWAEQNGSHGWLLDACNSVFFSGGGSINNGQYGVYLDNRSLATGVTYLTFGGNGSGTIGTHFDSYCPN
jgi:hypothetical protein